MNFTPQVETAEISDAGLDSVSGGLAGGMSGGLAGDLSGGLAGGLSGGVQAGSVGVCADVFGAGSAEGATAGVSIHAGAH
ncbi:hypothetical protein ACFPH6_10690 [Streptomyces xiangluensis]|uniref:Uncharacterized protein n=1 Tax=Streptomyces xiangluensis TaxID=2665720 RepID=A0ABV8YL72_9ACTN